MKHIFIDEDIKKKAASFRERLRKGLHNGYISPKTQLTTLRDQLPSGSDEWRYVEKIIAKWEDLIIAEPDEFDGIIAEFEGIIDGKDIEKKIVTVPEKNSKTGAIEDKNRKFYKLIVEVMRYDYVQSSIYPDFMEELGIKTCVYCNAQYAFSVAGRNGYHNYELDHYKPKSLYPYLCTTFMNLQPSCSTCNKKKSDEVPPPDEEIFQLFVKESTVKSDSPVEFRLDNAGVIKYLIDPNVKSLKIDFSCPGKPKLEKGYNHFFKISTLYQAHTDIAEELIWKSRIYNKVIIEDYKRLFTGLGFKNSDFQRFILGNYDQTEDILKRPMAKMTQDIARQLHLIEKPK